MSKDVNMPVFRRDPCGITCLFLTYTAIFYADYVIVHWVIIQTMSNSLWGALHVLLFNTLVFMTLMAHVRAVFSDPGIVPLPQSRLDFSDMHAGGEKSDDWTVCARCEMYRPPRAHHCRICQRCIRRMDHHCPWINNCVGEWNQKYFLQFLTFVGLMSIYALSLIAYSWIKDCPECSKEMMIKQGRLLHSVILSMESILFGLFVIAIMCDQMQAILSDETAVEQVKRQGPYRAKRPKMALLKEVCGRSHPVLWVFPCTSAPFSSEPSYSLTV
ncbi:palmitoyltransferase ZDHHC3-like [Penaeus monodon]|uniref:palmitoyltransferase ZDHHC3-like n=1 Tax=Penaeus monodon TaxID=6687 RepID=UPI0018A7C1B0|nr:palmitoyltransferase ZDHHC3-like [Penaeus monodon]